MKLRERNLVFKLSMKKAIKEVKKAIASWEKKWVTKLVQEAYSAIDKAQKRNLLHKNTAARRKSQIARLAA